MANAQVATYAGRAIIWNRIKGSGTEPKYLAWGDAPAALTGSAISNVNLFKPQTEVRTTATTTSLYSTSFLGDTYQVVGSIQCAVGAKTITEAALFDSATNTPNSTTVTTSMTASQTSVVIGAASGIASGNYYRQIENETVLVTAGQNTTTETIVRGRQGSVSATHNAAVSTTVGGDGGSGALTGPGVSEQTATVGAAQGGNMFAHADFGGIALAISDSINFTWTDQLI
jgi:hypothetical protein